VVPGFDSWRGLGIFLFTTASRTVLGPTQPPIQWVPGAFTLGVKRPGREADHSLPSSAEVKECVELYIHSPNMPSRRGAQLQHRDNFTFTFNFNTFISRSNELSLTKLNQDMRCIFHPYIFTALHEDKVPMQLCVHTELYHISPPFKGDAPSLYSLYYFKAHLTSQSSQTLLRTPSHGIVIITSCAQ
jgi:hypothetical protein